MTETFGTTHHKCVISQKDLVDHLEEAVLVKDLPGMADVDSSCCGFAGKSKRTLSSACRESVRMRFSAGIRGFIWLTSSLAFHG